MIQWSSGDGGLLLVADRNGTLAIVLVLAGVILLSYFLGLVIGRGSRDRRAARRPAPRPTD